MADNNDPLEIKIAQPLVHASLQFGQFSELEGVFVPSFGPHRFAANGRWAPAQVELLSVVTPPDTTSHIITPRRGFATTQPSNHRTLVCSVTLWPFVAARGNYQDRSVHVYAFRCGTYVQSHHQIGFDYEQVVFGFNARTRAYAFFMIRLAAPIL
jgi:hypothetical protein